MPTGFKFFPVEINGRLGGDLLKEEVGYGSIACAI